MPSTLAEPQVFKAIGVEVFPAGFHTSSNGVAKTWTTAELQEAAESYNAVVGSKHDAPIVLGHKGSTAYGWVERAFVDGDRLRFDIACNDKDFAEGVNTRKHPKRSVSFYPREHPNNPTPGKLNINHLAFLPTEGEFNPAIKGLADFKFSDVETDGLITIDFADDEYYPTAMSAIAVVMRKWRESIIERDGIEAADAMISANAIEAIARDANTMYVSWEEFYRQSDELRMMIAHAKDAIVSANNYSEVNSDMATKPKTDDGNSAVAEAVNDAPVAPTTEAPSTPAPVVSVQEFSELKATVAALELQGKAKDARIAQLESDAAKKTAELERTQLTSFVEGLVRDRKVLPADKDATVQELLWLPNADAIEFSEGGQTVSKTPRQARMDRLANGRELWSNSPLPIAPSDGPDAALTQDYAEAVRVYGDEISTDSVRDDARIRAHCKANGKDANNTSDYAEAMIALGITY